MHVSLPKEVYMKGGLWCDYRCTGVYLCLVTKEVYMKGGLIIRLW